MTFHRVEQIIHVETIQLSVIISYHKAFYSALRNHIHKHGTLLLALFQNSQCTTKFPTETQKLPAL
jgi:hypothetical protein